jgi:hypothetical protein
MWPDQDVFNYMFKCNEKQLLATECNNQADCLDFLHGHEHGLSDAIIHHGHEMPSNDIAVGWQRRLNASIAARQKNSTDS